MAETWEIFADIRNPTPQNGMVGSLIAVGTAEGRNWWLEKAGLTDSPVRPVDGQLWPRST